MDQSWRVAPWRNLRRPAYDRNIGLWRPDPSTVGPLGCRARSKLDRPHHVPQPLGRMKLQTEGVVGKLDGKVALITGSGRNIGRATALRFADEGAHVIVNARGNQAEADAVADEVRARGVKSLAILADVSSPAQVDAMVARALDEFGKIDILINNAAIRPHKPFREVTLQDWEAVRGVVLDGALYCTRAVIDGMVERQYGRILFFMGEGAFAGGSGRAHVSAAKYGLVGLSRSLAAEFAADNIRVNIVS